MLNKRLGQHFLRDEAVLNTINQAIAPTAGQTVLEIGPGDGALTEYLQKSGASVIALEVDGRFVEKLAQRYQHNARVRIIHTDALTADWRALAGAGARLVGNLPYNISTALLLKMARQAAWLQDCHVMVQKEVGQRLCAPPASADYGRLSVSLQLSFAVQWVCLVRPEAFVPPPAVESAVLRLLPQKTPQLPAAFEQVLAAAFGQRRKTLKNSLSALPMDWENCPLDSRRRAQSLSPAEFIQLAQYHLTCGSREG